MIINKKYNTILCKGCHTEELAKIRRFVIKRAIKNGFDEEVAEHIALAVDEVCTNIIKYAYKYDLNKEIEIETYIQGQNFVVKISDEGEPFDPKNVQQLDMQKYFKELKKGGLGIQIIRKIMDEIDYQSANNHTPKNSLLLKKTIPSN